MGALSELDVLVIDCQATAAAGRGHLLELGWACAWSTTSRRVHLIAPSDGERIPPAVARITGISESMVREGIDARLAWRELEAALLESDEIKRQRPPYNVALTAGDPLWFTAPDLGARGAQPSAARPLGPFASAKTLDEFGALARADRAALGSGRWSPDASTFKAGYERLCAAHRELSRMWLTRLVDASVVWREPGSGTRLMVIENGEIALSTAVEAGTTPPVPPGYRRSVMARREVFTAANFDRLRVLTTELKRLAGASAPVAVRFAAGPPLADGRVASALWWV